MPALPIVNAAVWMVRVLELFTRSWPVSPEFVPMLIDLATAPTMLTLVGLGTFVSMKTFSVFRGM